MEVANRDLRLRIAQMVMESKEGHIPSSYSIVDIIQVLYRHVLSVDPSDPTSSDRDHFILSKGHGAAALYAVMNEEGFFEEEELVKYSTSAGKLGGHPDVTRVPGVEASTGSLGHGFPTAVGTALGLRIQSKDNRVYCLLGDGECHEGTIWESANIASNLQLGNLCAIVDWNGSAAQLMPLDDLPAKWQAFGFNVHLVDGHSPVALKTKFDSLSFAPTGQPNVVIAKTIKGKGVSFIEGHGKWHHRIPNQAEWEAIVKELS